MLFNSGCVAPSADEPDALLHFEAAVLQLQLQLEASLHRASSASGGDSVIVYDRGVLDVAAYLPREQWPALSSLVAKDVRPMDWYTAVVHLVSAADGAAESWGSRPDAETAAALHIERVLSEVQASHPNYLRVDNSTDFEGKLQRATAAVIERLKAS